MTVVAMTYISEMFPAQLRGALPGEDPDDRPVRHSRHGVRRAIHHPDRALGLARGVRLGIARDRFPVLRQAGSRNRRAGSSIRAATTDADAAHGAHRGARVAGEVGELPPVAEARPSRRRVAGGFRELVASGSLGRLRPAHRPSGSARRSASTGSCRGCRRCSSNTVSTVVRSLEQSSAMSIGAVPGAWIASKLSDRWERKSPHRASSRVVIATCGLSYGLSFRTTTIVIFGFLVAMGAAGVRGAALRVHAGVFSDRRCEIPGPALSYGIGRLANAFVGPFIVAFLFKQLRLHDGLRLHRRLLGDRRDPDDGRSARRPGRRPWHSALA